MRKWKLIRDFKNAWFLLRICFKTAPLYTFWYMCDKIRNEIGIFVEHALAVYIVLSAVEFGRPFRGVAIFLLALFAFEILHMGLDAFRSFKLQPKAMPRIQQALKMKLFEKAREIDLESYDNPSFYNDYIMAINESDNQLDKILQTMENFVSSVTRILLYGGFFIAMDPISFIFVAVSFVLVVVVHNLIKKLNFKRDLEVVPIVRKAEYVQRVFYLPDYAKEIRLNPQIAEHFQQDHQKIYEEIIKTEKKYVKKFFILHWLKDYMFNVFVMNILYMSYLIYSALVLGRISIASVAVFYGAAWTFKNGVERISRTLVDIVDISRYVERIHVFLNKKPTIVSTENRSISHSQPAEIIFKNVSFRYSENAPYALYNINMTIKAGQKTAIVGYNGAGKSTLVKLIMRLYDPTEGEILFNGINIKEYNVDEYRRAIGVIFQDYKLFAASITENVLLDIEENGEINRGSTSLKKAGFAERLTEFEQGLNQQLTSEFVDDGVNLSGGEAQKVAIARAFYKDAPLIILDEPSSALDPIAEYHFNQTVIEAESDKTMVFISHRLSTTRISDAIIMMENGQIEEQGTHDSLLSSKGKYAQMWAAQTSRYSNISNE